MIHNIPVFETYIFMLIYIIYFNGKNIGPKKALSLMHVTFTTATGKSIFRFIFRYLD